MVPTPQKTRPIGFVLDTGGLNSQAPLTVHNLSIRPSDLSRTEPSRVSVQQTLGGGWVDSFGPGLGTITIAGNTGWRPKSPSGRDWLSEYVALRDAVYVQWHQYRARALVEGKSPDVVKLVFVDTLDKIVSVVVPTVFSIKRSKSQPLLISYNIVLPVIVPRADDGYVVDLEKAAASPDSLTASIDSLADSIDKLNRLILSAEEWLESNIRGPILAFMRLTSRAMAFVNLVNRGIDSIAVLARDIATAGMTVFQVLAAAAAIPERMLIRHMEAAAVFRNMFCILKNRLGDIGTYPDFSDLYGASNCSSTAGGSPLSPLRNGNPFYALTTPVAGTKRISQTAEARESHAVLAMLDPYTQTMPSAELAFHAGRIAAGTYIA
jgi:hypothetical protein